MSGRQLGWSLFAGFQAAATPFLVVSVPILSRARGRRVEKLRATYLSGE